MDCSTPGLPVHHQFSELAQTHVHESVMPSNHLILFPPLLLRSSIFPSIRVFSKESILLSRWPKYWRFSFSISPSNEYSGLICFRMDWLDLLAVQGTLNNLFQHHSSKASILRSSAFFMVQLTSIHDYWKNHSFDLTDLCWQSKCLCFLTICLGWLQLFFSRRLIYSRCHTGTPKYLRRDRWSELFSLHENAWSCLCDPMDCSLPGSSVHEMGCHFFLQGIFPTQGSNPSFLQLLHLQTDALSLSHLGRLSEKQVNSFSTKSLTELVRPWPRAESIPVERKMPRLAGVWVP